ncbi:B-cell receptor CD22-like [Gymnodraco acuticeps]|uniref:B-cell receptor CD22-like n=1 Tax=Gymnodraco acuticeps TaxID=8218 RepID=A0A6P8W568_GYMAC|nr:B-cell receptor CD22-like [Gymnodraco acuticeps]
MSLPAAARGFVVFLLVVQVVQGQDVWGVTYSSTEICAVKGSTVEIRCSYTYPSTWKGGVNRVKKTFWFTKWKGDEPVDLTTDSAYAGRLEDRCENNICTLRIRNLRESDSAVYRFRFTTNQDVYASDPVTLSVTGLQVKVTKGRNCHTGNCIYATLKCLSSCPPTSRPSYIWYKNGLKSPKQGDSFYDYFYPKESYACAVKGYENSPSPSVCVNGQACNTVAYSERSICAFKGSSVDISCTYSSNAYVQSKFWFSPERRDQDLSTDSQYAGRVQILETERGRSTLRISDLRDSDSAQYRFKFKTPSFEWRSDLPGTTLTVTALQVQVITATVQQSDTLAELKCHSSCSPAGGVSYVWFKNGEKIHTTSISSYKGLLHHADRISCAFEGHEDFPSPAVYSPKLPSVSVSPSAEIQEGSSVTLTCSSDANPAANYTWYKRNRKEYLPLLKKEPKLVFSSINSSDSGQYCCTAGNKLGTKASKDISIDVNYAPKTSSVSASPSAKIEIGKSLQLTCKGGANPAANYTWYKDNQTLPWGSKDIHQLVSITLEDKGNYHCESKNKYGQINSTSVHIDVQYAPKLPSVSVSPSAEIEEGSSVTLTCSSDANPAANYTWYKRNEDSPKASGQIFNITDFRAEHSGSYYCVTQNKIGRLNSTLHLSIVAGSMKSVAAGSITAVIVGIIFLIAFLLIRRKRSSKPTTEAGERPDNDAQVRMYDRPSAEVQNATPEPEAEVCYASARFIQNQEDALYSNIKPAHLRRHKKDEKDKEEDVVYSTLTFKGHSATAESERHEAADDPSALYSVVNKKPRLDPCSVYENVSDLNMVSAEQTEEPEEQEDLWLRKGGEPVDLTTDSEYAGRVEHLCENNICTLRIKDLIESDSAEYKFRFATNYDEFVANLESLCLSQLKVSRAYSGQAELKCHTSCRAPDNTSYIWYKNGEELWTGISYSGLVNFGSADIYSCALNGQENHRSPSVYAPKPPSVSVSPSAEIEEGSSVTLTCSSDANPAANYTWYKKNGLIYSSEEYQIVFSSIYSSDSGECSKASLCVSESLCWDDANPAAKYTWYKDETSYSSILNEEPQLVFSSMQASDSGEYFCTAENKLGRRTSEKLFIDVKCE